MTYDSEVAADSPWGYWKTDETSGTNLADSSGNARPLTITGSPTLAQTGPSLAADAISWPSSASTEHYAISTATITGSAGEYSLECWFYLPSTPTALTPLVTLTFSAYGNTSARPISLYLDTSGNLVLRWGISTSVGTSLTSAGAVSTGAWHHVVATVKNGVGGLIRLDKSTVASGGNTTLSFTTGAKAVVHGGGNMTGASIDLTNGDVVTTARPAVYSAALTTARIDAHYDAMGLGAASGTAALSLSASGAAAAPGSAPAVLSLSASGNTAGPVGGTASLSLSAAGAAGAPGVGAGNASLSLSAGAYAYGPSNYAPAVLGLSPIAYWRLGEQAGTTMFDSSGHGRHGTYEFSPILGAIGALLLDDDTAVTFTNTPDAVVPYWSGLDFTTFTIVGLVRISPIYRGRAFAGRDGQANSPIQLWCNASTGAVDVVINTGASTVTYSGSVVVGDGTNHMVAVRRDNATGDLSILVDGVVDITVPSSAAPDTGTTFGWLLGTSQSGTPSAGTHGTLDEFALFDTALSDADISLLAVTALGASGTAALSLSASGTSGASSGGSAALTLIATGDAVGPALASGTAALSLSATGVVAARGSGLAFIEFDTSSAAAALYATDTSNALDGLDIVFVATVTIARPAVTPPTNLGVKYDKAIPYPEPVMVNGRPT